MTEPPSSEFPDEASDHDDPVLSLAGARLRERSDSLSPTAIEVSVLRRRSRRLSAVAGSAFAVIALLSGVLVFEWSDGGSKTRSGAEILLAGLDDQPVDPAMVRLVSNVSAFDDCDALIDDLRRVGAEHVGSRGFGSSAIGNVAEPTSGSTHDALPTAADLAFGEAGGAVAGTTLGTNVQVAGVDELDHVKAVGSLIYDLDNGGNLDITDAATLKVVSSVDVTRTTLNDNDNDNGMVTADQLLVDGDRVIVFGTESEVSKPIKNDPSGYQAMTNFVTITFVDATDVAAPVVTDRVRVEGRLVSARLVEGEVRFVATSNIADLGLVMPTTVNSVDKALEQNRRSVALSQAADWIPDWQRAGADPKSLVPCERVHIPDTFAGVAMTSMVTFPIATGTFQPAATSILAPGDTLYAGIDKVAISSGIWVDPIDQLRLRFDDWKTAVHEFSFSAGQAPSYVGSAIVEGSTVGQFAFGEIGDSLGVVTTTGTPWAQDTSTNTVDLVLLTPDGKGVLTPTGKVKDLAGGPGYVSAVRFVDGAVLVSAGTDGRQVRVVDVSDPAAPRRAGELTVAGSIGYFHPLSENRSLLIGSRFDQVDPSNEGQSRSWVVAQLLDLSNPDSPQIVSTWERPWSTDTVSYDHHAFTFWPERGLAMWGIQDVSPYLAEEGPPNHVVVLGVGDTLSEVALPIVNKAPEGSPPCPEVAIVDPVLRERVGNTGRVLRCDDGGKALIAWPRYTCSRVSPETVAEVAPNAPEGDYVLCNPAASPSVSRVLVVNGRPILLTDQTLEELDPETFATKQIENHPS